LKTLFDYDVTLFDSISALKLGDEVYTPEAPDDTTEEDWYQGKAEGGAPRFQELIAALRGRGIDLVYVGNRYWQAMAL